MQMTATLAETYQAQLDQLDRDLHPYKFPLRIELENQDYMLYLWSGSTVPDRFIAIDTETELIQGHQIPRLALACVYGDAGSLFLIHPDNLGDFLQKHADRTYVAHNAVFDFWVICQHLASNPAQAALWWEITNSGRLLCTMLLDQLVRLARFDGEPVRRNLGIVGYEYAGVTIDKDDPYRLRYGELLGVPRSEWTTVDPGFWEYAAKDPIATLLAAKEQLTEAITRVRPFVHELLPACCERFGPLTATLQVKGAIALDYISKVGMWIDEKQVENLKAAINKQVDDSMERLEDLAEKPLFKRRKKDGSFILSKASGLPSREAKTIKGILKSIVDESNESDDLEPIRPPINKDGLVTDSAKYWHEHTDLHPFISEYCQYIEQATLMKFFRQLTGSHIHPKYEPLKRTGRTSCRDPNLQNIPRDPRFREMFVAPPGYYLLQIDYSAQELRTLAQVCIQRYGESVLADLFREGIDPHVYTARLLIGKSEEEFAALDPKEQKLWRQRAKSTNFGVPGGLGAKSLVAYAKQVYGIDFTLEEAKEFRQKLITKVYPELKPYLSDNAFETVARNLNSSTDRVREVFDTWYNLRAAERAIAGDEDDLNEIQDAYNRLLRVGTRAKDSVRNALLKRETSPELARRIFCGSVATLSGRIRGHVRFSQRANTPFQGAAADANKLALFELLRCGYQLCGFVHDEILVLIPENRSGDYTHEVQQVQSILHEAMRTLTPDVPVATEYLLADRWYKDVSNQPIRNGCIVPYSRDNEFPEWGAAPNAKLPEPKKTRPKYEPEQIDSFCLDPSQQP